MKQREILHLVSASRLGKDLWRLVTVESPTCQEREAALVFLDMLAGCGAKVEIDETIPDSPSVIGRLKGNRPGPTLQLAGHIDHIPVPHDPPERDGETVSARGASDMKGGLAGILEMVRLLSQGGCDFPGEILVTVYGLHEAPLGLGRGLRSLIDLGIHGDAALVMEGPADQAIVCGKGQSIWNLTLNRDGETCHELRRPPGSDSLIDAALDVAAALRARNRELSVQPHGYPLLGAETVFIGQLRYGDFYNRQPSSCFLQGTWRWHPDKVFENARKLLHELVAGMDLPDGISVQEEWTFVGESFSEDPEEPVVRAYQQAHRELQGSPIEIAGASSIMDTSLLVPMAGVPTVPVAFDGGTAHADREVVSLSRLAERTRIALLAALIYLEARSPNS